MNLTNIMGAASAAVPQTTPTNQWSSTPFSTDEPVKTEQWLYACFCTPCAAAQAKSKVDRTDPIFNFLCFYPWASYNHVRLSYNILGDCGQDLLYGMLCAPCGARQALTETAQLGEIGANYGQGKEAWTIPLFSCDMCECAKAALCPCVISHQTRVMLLPQAATEPWFDYLCLFPPAMYGQARHHMNIKSDWPLPTCEDVFVGLLFFPCALPRALKEAGVWRSKQTVGGVASAVSNVADAAKGKLAKMGIRV